jgi:leader peptidase (prepilin peptidase)/N-methyltransferase
MQTMPAILLFPAGLIFGSFLTVVGHRVPRGEPVVGGRSRCPACNAQIAAYDNIPLVSWLLLRGRARCCGARISPRYPLTELTLGLLFAATALVLADEDPAELVLGLIFVATLLAVTITDLERRVIPDKILAVSATAAIVIVAATDPAGLPERALAAAGAGGLFFAAALAYPRGMGLGDVKLAATMGLFLGSDVGPAIFVALMSASLVGLAIVARDGAGARKRAIPFGPFLALGGVVGLLAGEQLIDLYLRAF